MASKEPIEGFNPKQYRNMAILFVILSVINMATVILAFARTGYGLWHAEEALSHVSKVTQCVQEINESALNIVIHSSESTFINNEVQEIKDLFSTIDAESKDYLDIPLDEIDPNLKANFEDASSKVQAYRDELSKFNTNLTKTLRSDGEERSGIVAKYLLDIEPLKEEAEKAMNNVFDVQNESTTQFFYRAAQQFVFVLLLLILTLVVGLIGISKMKRNARRAAEKIAEEHRNAVKSQNKVIDIAYSNILTGFKNRYALEEDLKTLMQAKTFAMVVTNFNNFSSVNETYGRSVADEFISQVSQRLTAEYDNIATIYSTAADEFCFIFKNRMNPMQTENLAQQIAKTLSRPFDVSGVSLQLTASCCFYRVAPGMHKSFNSLFKAIDRAMITAKSESRQFGTTSVINVNNIQ